MKIKNLLLFVCLLLGVQGVWADNLSLDEAKQKAAAFLQQKVATSTSKRKVKVAPSAAQLQKVAVDAENLYVFNMGGDNGFVIMANDDSYDGVLGYCDSGSIDPNDMPDALRDILQVFNYNVGQGNKTLSKRARAPRKAPANLPAVKPLTRTYFNQSGPEGMYLPIVVDEEGHRRVAPSGCVACATAQVIAYYQWPNTVKGTSGYKMTKTVDDNNINSPEEFRIYTHDSIKVKGLPSYDINWNNIYQGSYNDDYAPAQTSPTFNYARNYSGDKLAKMQEVGRLFLYVCNTLPMTYFGTTGTGAVSAHLATILPKYWGYKNQIKVNQRRNYTRDTWIQLLYEEISNERLVVYAGTAEKDDGSTGAHTFILDGYDGVGYWHINWGWNGKCDGYFDFENLLPYGLPDDTDGYTVSRNGYVLRQHAITGIEPDRDGTATKNSGYLTAAYSEIRNSFTYGGTTYGKTMVVYFENPNPTITTNQVSWALLNEDGTINGTSYGNYRNVKMLSYEREDYASNAETVTIDGKDEYRHYFAPLDRVVSKFKLTKPGTYKIVPVCRKSGDTNYRICDGADKFYFTVTIDSQGKASVTAHPQIKLSLAEIKVVGDQIVGHSQEIQVLVKNESPDEFAGMVRLSFTEVPEGAEKPAMRTASANILPGDTCKVKFPIILNKIGEYTVKPNYRYRQDVYTPFSDTFTFEITSESGKSANISTSFNLTDNVDDIITVGNRYYLKGNSLVGTFRVKNSGTASGYRCTYVQLYNSSNTDKASLVGSARIDGNIAPGYTIDLPFHFNNLDLTAGKIYYLRTSCQSTDAGYASGGSTYQVLAAPSLTYWNKDGEETSMWIEPNYTSTSSGWSGKTETYKYNLAIPSDAVAVDMANAVSVMKRSESSSGGWFSSTKIVDDYTFTPATNPNCLYFVDAQPTTEVSNLLRNKNLVVANVAPQVTLTGGYEFYTPNDFTASNISYSRKFDIGNKRRVGGGWQSIVLPFEVQSVEIDGAAKTWFKNESDDADFWVYQYMGDKSLGYGSYDVIFNYLDSETMQAHTPYIMAVPDASWGAEYNLVGKTLVFKATDATITQSSPLTKAGSYYSFSGTYENLTDQQGIYTLDAEGKSFTSSATTVSPFVAYLYGKDHSKAPARINIAFEDAFVTAINNNRFEQADDQASAIVYDIQGRQISTKGLQSLPKGLYIINGKKIVK